MEEAETVTKSVGERLQKARALQMHILDWHFVSKAQPGFSRQSYISNEIGFGRA